MKSKLITHRSDNLDRDMDVRVYGTAGQTVVAFPTQGMTASNLEDNGMVDALADYIESGVIQLFCVGSVDDESWAAYDVDPAERAARQEDYYNYVCDEVIPLVRKEAGADARPLTLGCDLGAAHAAVFALRRPDLFQGCMSLSGVYDSARFFGDWMDDTLYGNVPCAFLPNMDADHPYVEVYRLRQFLFCTGQSDSEADCVRTTRALGEAFARLDVDVWCDFWGYDVTHEWSWWNKQIRYFMPIVLEDVEKTRALEGPAPKKAPAKKAPAKKPAAKKAPAKKPAAEKEPAPKKAPAKKAPAKKDAKAEEPVVAPAKAEKPAVPVKAEKPAAPAKAVKPAAPAKAEKPAAPAKAEKPAAPAKAEKPAAPAKVEPKAAAAKPAAKAAPKPKAEPAAAKPAAKAAPKPKAEPAKKAEPKPAAKAAEKPEPAAEKPAAAAKPAAKAAPKPKAEPKAAAAKPAAKKAAAKPAATKKAEPKSNA